MATGSSSAEVIPASAPIPEPRTAACAAEITTRAGACASSGSPSTRSAGLASKKSRIASSTASPAVIAASKIATRSQNDTGLRMSSPPQTSTARIPTTPTSAKTINPVLLMVSPSNRPQPVFSNDGPRVVELRSARGRRALALIRWTGSSSEWKTRSRTSCSGADEAKSASTDR